MFYYLPPWRRSVTWSINYKQVVSYIKLYTGWSKSHATHIKIVIDGWNLIQFDWINKHTISLTIQEPTLVTSCSNLLAPVRQLFSNSRSARMFFSQAQRVSIVEHYLASHSYFTYQNEFRDAFPDFSVPNKSTISRLVKPFPWQRKRAG
jgi:hypothetical protein